MRWLQNSYGLNKKTKRHKPFCKHVVKVEQIYMFAFMNKRLQYTTQYS